MKALQWCLIGFVFAASILQNTSRKTTRDDPPSPFIGSRSTDDTSAFQAATDSLKVCYTDGGCFDPKTTICTGNCTPAYIITK